MVKTSLGSIWICTAINKNSRKQCGQGFLTTEDYKVHARNTGHRTCKLSEMIVDE